MVFVNEILVWHGSNLRCHQCHAVVQSLRMIPGMWNRLFIIHRNFRWIYRCIEITVRYEHHLVVKHFLIPGWNWSEFFIHVKDEFVKPSTEESMAVKSSNISCDNHIKHFIVKPTLIRIKNIKSCFIKVISSSTSLISICLSAIMRTPGHFLCYGTLLEPKHGVLIMYSRALFKITSYLR